MAPSSISPAYGDVSHTVEGPTASQWGAVQQEIRVLYLIEKKPLKDVKRILEERHGFRATERMFKSRLSAWKFTKNSSDKEYQICAILHKTRRDKGKQRTAFIINGNRRTLKDLFKYIKGRKMSVEEFYAIALKTVGAAHLEDEQQVRAITPEPDAEDGHESDAESEHEGNSITTRIQSFPDASGSVAGESRRHNRHHRKSTSSSSNLAHHMTYASLEPRAASNASMLPTPSLEPLRVPHVVSTPDSYGTSPSSSSYPGYITSPRSSPRRSFSRNDIESIAHSTIYSNPLQQIHGVDNLDSWAILSQGASDTSSLSDFDVICPRCHKATSEHFSTLCNLESPQPIVGSPYTQRNQSPRDIFDSTPDLPSPAAHFSIPVSTKQHDHSWKWVSHCFSACIYYSRSRYSDTSDHNLVQNTPTAATAPNDFMYAGWDLERAASEFRAMIMNYDPNMLVAITQTVMVLGMHNWGNITSHIISHAADVAREVLGEDHPIYLLARYVTLMSSQKTMYAQSEITSATLENIWQAFVTGWSPQSTSEQHATTIQHQPYTIPAEGEAGRRAIPALYLYASSLTNEAHLSSSPLKESKLAQAEYLLRHCYTLACQTFHKSHLQAIAALLKLHLVLERQGRLSEAIEVIERAVKDGRGTLGKWHPRQLQSLRLLGALVIKRWTKEDSDERSTPQARNSEDAEIRRRKRIDEQQKVEAILWEVLEGRVRMLGRKHESSMASKQDLIDWLTERGRWVDGLDKQKVDDIWEWTDLGREDHSIGGRRDSGEHVQTGLAGY